MVVVSAVAITLVNEYIPDKSQAYLSHKKKYKPIIDAREKGYESVIAELQKGSEREKYFATQLIEIREKADNDLKEYQSIKSDIIANDRVIGYTSLKNFFLGIGIRIFAFVVCLFYFHKVIKSHVDKNKKKWEIAIGSVLLLCSSYWVSWAFLFKINSKGLYDFERYMYNLALYVLPLIVVLSSYYIFKYNKSTIEKLTKAFSDWFNFTSETVPQVFVPPGKAEEYIKHHHNLIDKTDL